MGLIGRIGGLAPLRAFPVIGWNGERAWRRLVVSGAVVESAAPHDSELMVLAGAVPEAWIEALHQLFETFALPRLAMRVGGAQEILPHTLALDAERPDWRAVRARLGDLAAAHNRAILPDRPPAPWRGVGPHGQGGEGMMGGKPYGRPMAMTAEDPDQLMLGDVTTALGPFFPGLPPGLALEVQMQGDRVRAVNHALTDFPVTVLAEAPELAAGADWGPAARVAMGEDVRLAELEGARIDAHLGWAAALLRLAGLPAPGARMAAAAARGERDPRRLRALWAAAERFGLRRMFRGRGRVPPEQAEALGLVGPAARASGRAADARRGDRACIDAGFRHAEADAGCLWARWQVRRDECLEAARLIAEAGDRPARAPEAPAGPVRDRGEGRLAGPSAANLAAVNECLPGMEWSDAILFIASLGLDLREAALR